MLMFSFCREFRWFVIFGRLLMLLFDVFVKEWG